MEFFGAIVFALLQFTGYDFTATAMIAVAIAAILAAMLFVFGQALYRMIVQSE